MEQVQIQPIATYGQTSVYLVLTLFIVFSSKCLDLWVDVTEYWEPRKLGFAQVVTIDGYSTRTLIPGRGGLSSREQSRSLFGCIDLNLTRPLPLLLLASHLSFVLKGIWQYGPS